ncbi:hypothetical protein NKH77_48920 [Streptomyces sp. M19]
MRRVRGGLQRRRRGRAPPRRRGAGRDPGGRGVYVRERGAASTMARSWTRERLQGSSRSPPTATVTATAAVPATTTAAVVVLVTVVVAPGRRGRRPGRRGGRAAWAASEDARTERGVPTSTTEGASPEIAGRLSVPVGEPVIRSDYLLKRDGVPAMLCVSWESLGITGGTPSRCQVPGRWRAAAWWRACRTSGSG